MNLSLISLEISVVALGLVVLPASPPVFGFFPHLLTDKVKPVTEGIVAMIHKTRPMPPVASGAELAAHE